MCVYRPLHLCDFIFLVGRYCEYENINVDRSIEFDTFDAYLPTLVLECDDGEPGMFTWTPDENTPDTVYYQVGQYCALR